VRVFGGVTTIKSIYPDICASDLIASRDFYTTLVGLEAVWESDWYIALNVRPGPMQAGRNLRVSSADEYRLVGAAFDDLFSWADTEGLSNDGDGICVIHAAAHDQLHLTIGVRPDGDPTDFELPDDTLVVNIEGGPTALALHHGPLQSLPMAHASLTDWVYKQRREAVGSARETYVGSLDEQTTRIEVPLAP